MGLTEASIYAFDDFHVDVGRGLLLRDGLPVALQWKSFETLCFLVKSKGRLVTRNELMESLWADTFVDENNLSQHIRALRKALGSDKNGKQFIETIPRRGYRFIPPVQLAEPKTSSPAENNAGPTVRNSMLIGREREIREIGEILLRHDVPILTLTGIGGTGKTALVKAVAKEMSEYFRDGVYIVEMGAIADPDLVASTITQALDIKETGGPVLEVLKSYFSGRSLLLVIDNFEQVLSAAPSLAELSRSAPGLKILVTSRAVLELSISYDFVVPPLGLPDCSAEFSIGEVSRSESVRLFVERSRAANPNFALNDENAHDIAEICTRLDGLPLAIELAAARVRIIPPAAILERLDNRLALLTGGAKDLPARQQTVRNTLRWSYELLTAPKQMLFRRLAVFSGGFTLEAAEAVLGNSNGGLSSINVLDGITSLVGNSLLVQKEPPAGQERFSMLEVVREYALEELETSEEAEQMRSDHAAYFAKLAETADPLLQRGDSVKWLNHLEEENDNLRAALYWSLERQPETAGRLAAALRFFWLFHTHIVEGHKWITLAFERNDTADLNIRSKLLNGIGVGARIRGDYDTAYQMHSAALAASMESGDRLEIALSYRGLGAVAARQADLKLAQECYERTLEISRELNDRSEIGYSLGSLGGLARLKGDNNRARELLKESLETVRELGQDERVITNLLGLGVIAYLENDSEQARSFFAEALLLATRLMDKIHISDLLDGFAAIACRSDAKRCALLAGSADQIRRSIGYEIAPAERLFRNENLDKARAEIGEAMFAKLYDSGGRLSTDDAVALALGQPHVQKLTIRSNEST